MRAIVQTITAVALGISSLTLGSAVQADAFAITYSEGYWHRPAYSLHSRHGRDYCAPDYQSPRHLHQHHHYDRQHKHKELYRRHRDDGHGHYGPPGHGGGLGYHHRSQYGYRDGDAAAHRDAPGHQGGRSDGAHSKRAHLAYGRP